MSIHTLGEFLIWYCDWCDSTNQIHWSNAGGKELICAACHHQQSDTDVEEFGLLRRAA